MGRPVWDCHRDLTKIGLPLEESCDTIAANRGAYGPPAWASVLPPQELKIEELRIEFLPGSTLEPNSRALAWNRDPALLLDLASSPGCTLRLTARGSGAGER